MRAESTEIDGVLLIQDDPASDLRGSFTSSYRREFFVEHGIEFEISQVAVSRNPRVLTLRGLHFQTYPFQEAKLVSCLSGALFDVGVDLRPDSSTLGRTFTTTLAGDGNTSIFMPAGCAHGFLTLEPDTSVLYSLSNRYDAAASSGIRWNDPGIDIVWPNSPQVISHRDSSFPDYNWSPNG